MKGFEQPGISWKMQVFVRSTDATFVVDLQENATVADLKAAIEDKEFIPAGSNVYTIPMFLSIDFC